MIVIEESGMKFGPFPEEKVFWIEKSESHLKLGEGVKTVEFLYYLREKCILLIEAKNSSPQPEKGKFDDYISDITEKFVHSFNLWMTIILRRRSDQVSEEMLKDSIKDCLFKFVLVINGHEEAWLPPVREALCKKLIAERKIWGHEIIVLNDSMAAQKGLIS